jgi:hypothetical protein
LEDGKDPNNDEKKKKFSNPAFFPMNHILDHIWDEGNGGKN